MSILYIRKNTIGVSYFRHVSRRPIIKTIQKIEFDLINDYISFVGLKNSRLFSFIGNSYKNFIKSIKIINTKNGCSQCEVEFLDLPDFEIEPFTKLIINANNQNLFYGYLDFLDEKNIKEKNEIIKITFKGLIEQLKRVRVEKTYPSNTRIIDIIDDLIKNHVIFETDIKYNNKKIDFLYNLTQTSASIETSKSNVYELIEKLSLILSYDWGVDDVGEFFCVPKKQNIEKVFFEIGNKIDYAKNFKDIRNIITIKRQSATGTGETGWTIASQITDNTSVSKYGKKFYDLQVPGYFDDNSCNIIAHNILKEFKEPKNVFRITNYQFKNNKIEKFNIGRYKAILNPADYFELINDCDDLSQINFDTNDITASEEIANSDFISGAGALRIYNIQSNSNKIYKFLNLNIYGYIKSLLFFCKFKNINNSQHKNFKIKLWFGENSYLENNLDYFIENNIYYLAKINFINPLRKLNEFAIQLNDNKTDIEIYFDKFYLINYNYKHIDNYLSKIEYIINEKESKANLEFEYEPEKFESFIQGLISSVEMLKFITEKR